MLHFYFYNKFFNESSGFISYDSIFNVLNEATLSPMKTVKRHVVQNTATFELRYSMSRIRTNTATGFEKRYSKKKIHLLLNI